MTSILHASSAFTNNFLLDSSDDEDLYTQLKTLQKQEEFLDIQEEYIKDETRNLKRELIRAKEVSALHFKSNHFCSFILI